jgi:hypothetical protein
MPYFSPSFFSGSTLERGSMRDIDHLTTLILEAKAKTYVGGGTALPLPPARIA